MAAINKMKFTCFLFSSEDAKNQVLIDAFNELMKEIGGRMILFNNKKLLFANSFEEVQLNEISKSDIVFLESTFAEPEIFYGAGLAQALGKPILSLFQSSKNSVRPIPNSIYIDYEITPEGLKKLKAQIRKIVSDYVKNPTRFLRLFPYTKKIIEPSYVIDLEKLEAREYENLIFELISQMGFKKVSWGTELKEIDVVATLPKKDPDGFEYSELWLFVTGNKGPSERLLDMILFEPEYLLNRVQKIFEGFDLFSKNRPNVRSDTPITILFLLKETDNQEMFERRIERAEGHYKNRRYPFNIRIRTWDQGYTTKMIQTYPQIAFKYFSEESRTKSKYRKSPEELYNENITLTEQLLRSKAIIEEEKRKRFIAERETAWRDVAFKAAHKLGNPVDATDTYLQSLKRKLKTKDINKANEIANLMDDTIEEAKSVIGQFKSLTKIEEINAKSSDVIKIIFNCCKTAEEQGVSVKIQSENKLPKAFVDPIRIAECFNELVANSLHWFDKEEKKIYINCKRGTKDEIPEPLDNQKGYLKIQYQDNGIGVDLENKEKIFSPFFSTYQHGTGLGLSIVKKVIELQGGWIIENGEFGKGASFILYLPLEKSQSVKLKNK